jgi:hypothetical protein
LETLFPITMPFTESRTEYSFWSLWSAPLMVSTGMRCACLLLPLPSSSSWFASHHHLLVNALLSDIRNMSSQMSSIIANPEGQ